ncbi:MAG: hypothetical protein FD160_2297 [Caulobacteraceae bacterium]|nr:MAG: hypothetical protein FD160_2297 [Caulobacteraceae bacterium]
MDAKAAYRPSYRPRLPSRDRLTAIAAEIGVWLCALAAWLVEAGEALGLSMRGLRMELRAELRAAGYDMERVIFLLACRELPARAPPTRQGRRPGAAPAGFRKMRDATGTLRRVRRVFASPDAHGSLRRRIARLRDLIDRRDLWIARVVRHITDGPHGAGLAPVAPPAARCASSVMAFAAAEADTS